MNQPPVPEAQVEMVLSEPLVIEQAEVVLPEPRVVEPAEVVLPEPCAIEQSSEVEQAEMALPETFLIDESIPAEDAEMILPETRAFEQLSTTELFEAPAQARPRVKKPRNPKLLWFALCEVVALGVLIPSAILVISRHFPDPGMMLFLNILTIAAAAAAAIIPIIFFAIAPALPPLDRS